MLRKLFKWSIICSLILVVLVVGVYIYSPATAMKGAGITATTVFKAIGKTKAYDNKYGVHPLLYEKVNKVINEANSNGIDLRVVVGYRSIATQQKYYNQGRTIKGSIITNAPAGLSYHNYGWAVDVVEYKNGNPNWKSKRWNEIGSIGKKHGLVWGGDWTRLVDKPHFQLSIKDILRHCIL